MTARDSYMGHRAGGFDHDNPDEAPKPLVGGGHHHDDYPIRGIAPPYTPEIGRAHV